VTDPYNAARAQALAGLREGGIPVGAALAAGQQILGEGHNRRIQQGDPTAHAEIDCLRNAGTLQSYRATTLYTTLTPCHLCSGAILLFGIPHLVIGETKTFDGGGTLALLRENGVTVEVRDDASVAAYMREFIDRDPESWAADSGQST
jgi:cytosine/creatinine deaminase